LIYLVVSIIVIIWFTMGGVINLKEMLNALKTMKRNHADDGFVTNEDLKKG